MANIRVTTREPLRTDATYSLKTVLIAMRQKWCATYTDSFTKTFSPHSRVAAPFYICHFTCLDINFEWTARLWESILGEQNNIVAWL